MLVLERRGEPVELVRGALLPPAGLLLAVVPAIWPLGRMAQPSPARLQLVTATIVVVAAVALAVTLTQ